MSLGVPFPARSIQVSSVPSGHGTCASVWSSWEGVNGHPVRVRWHLHAPPPPVTTGCSPEPWERAHDTTQPAALSGECFLFEGKNSTPSLFTLQSRV